MSNAAFMRCPLRQRSNPLFARGQPPPPPFLSIAALHPKLCSSNHNSTHKMACSLRPHRGADALPADCVCEDCLVFQREYCHVLNMVDGYQLRPRVNCRLHDAANQLYEAWFENQHDSEHKFVARRKQVIKEVTDSGDKKDDKASISATLYTRLHANEHQLQRQCQTYSLPFKFPEQPLLCFCDDCHRVAKQRYDLAEARMPRTQKKLLDGLPFKVSPQQDQDGT